MKYVLIGMLLNSLIASVHDTREACEGRAALLREKGVIVKCVEMPTTSAIWTGSVLNCMTGSCVTPSP